MIFARIFVAQDIFLLRITCVSKTLHFFKIYRWLIMMSRQHSHKYFADFLKASSLHCHFHGNLVFFQGGLTELQDNQTQPRFKSHICSFLLKIYSLFASFPGKQVTWCFFKDSFLYLNSYSIHTYISQSSYMLLSPLR